jgi:hypothetical protein
MNTICNIKSTCIFFAYGKSAQNDSAESLLRIQYWSSKKMFYKSLNLCYRVFRNTVQEYCTREMPYMTHVVLYNRESCLHCVTTSLNKKRGLENAFKGGKHFREQMEVKAAFHTDFKSIRNEKITLMIESLRHSVQLFILEKELMKKAKKRSQLLRNKRNCTELTKYWAP